MTRPIRILFIEDTEEDALLVLRELRRGGYAPEWRRVEDAAGLDAALGERWDVVLCDYSLPGFSALGALAQVRARADLPFIVVSGTVGEEVAVELMRAGVDDFVLKDRPARLVPAVERELREAASRADLRRAEDTLRRTEKLRSLGQMAAGIAHDLKNLLNPLGLHVEIVDRTLRRAGVQPPETIEAMRSILQRGVETIDRLRAFSRLEPEVIVGRVDLAAVTRESVELMRPRLADVPGVELRTEITEVGPLPAESNEVVGAIVNLIGNALDACGERGSIVVRVAGDDAAAWVEVVDDGPGMSPDIEARVFEPFFSTKGSEGTGLGLANVFATMGRHGGAVRLETAPGQGARFTLWFPRTPAH